MCIFNRSFSEKALPQTSQGNGLSPVVELVRDFYSLISSSDLSAFQIRLSDSLILLNYKLTGMRFHVTIQRGLLGETVAT